MLSNLLHAVSYLICIVLYEASSTITIVFQMSFLRGREVKSNRKRRVSKWLFKNIRASFKLT